MEEKPRSPEDAGEEEEDEIVESDIEFEGNIVEPDNDPQKMGDSSVEVTEEKRDVAQEAKAKAMESISEGKLEEAIEHLTEAISLNPTSAIMYGTRASVYIKMKKPNAAIRDANAALEINPDSAKGYKSCGMASALFGQWEEAAKDLHVASKLDYDEEISAVLKKVEPNAHKIEDQSSSRHPPVFAMNKQNDSRDAFFQDCIEIPNDGTDVWEIYSSQLKFGNKVSSGSYGDLYKGTYCSQEVAIKVLKIFRYKGD